MVVGIVHAEQRPPSRRPDERHDDRHKRRPGLRRAAGAEAAPGHERYLDLADGDLPAEGKRSRRWPGTRIHRSSGPARFRDQDAHGPKSNRSSAGPGARQDAKLA